MRMTVNQVCNGFIAGHFLDRLRNFPCIGLRRVHHDDTAIVNKKHRLDLVVRNHVETASEVLETVPLGWVDGRALSGSRHIEVFAGPYAYRRNRRHVWIRFCSCNTFLATRASGLRACRGSEHSDCKKGGQRYARDTKSRHKVSSQKSLPPSSYCSCSTPLSLTPPTTPTLK